MRKIFISVMLVLALMATVVAFATNTGNTTGTSTSGQTKPGFTKSPDLQAKVDELSQQVKELTDKLNELTKPTKKPSSSGRKPSSSSSGSSSQTPSTPVSQPVVTNPPVSDNGFYVRPVEETRQSDQYKKLRQEMTEFAQDDAIIKFFGDVDFALIELLPDSSFDLTRFKLAEIAQIESNNYTLTIGAYEKNLEFLSTYAADDVLLTMVGVISGSDIYWTPLKTEVGPDGRAKVTFPQELLLKMQGREAALALLRAK